jgi:glucose-6-phosphate 1-dehydrogenase
MGGTGDLSKRKLIPALYKLILENKICACAIIAVSNAHTTIEEILSQAQKFISNIDAEKWEKLKSISYYFTMDFHDKEKYSALNKFIKKTEEKHKLNGNRIFYLATMPEHFDVITHNFSRYNIVSKSHERCDEEKSVFPWARVVYEKPFGFNLKSARALNRRIKSAFCENQVFRIDHYLGKELVGNIILARFTNRILEPIWNNKHIESVYIKISETIGIEGRGEFYDIYGALKDITQNHLLQIMSIVAMEPPKKLIAKYIRDEKAKVLKKISVEKALVGQYEGYRQESNVNKNSRTETFAHVKLFINNKRWERVPFYLTTGKYLDKKETLVFIKFKPVACLLDFCPAQTNYFVIKIDPEKSMSLGLNTKVPGKWGQVMPVTMDFCHHAQFGANTPEAYETLLLDVIKGDHSAFVRADEIEYSWKIFEKIDKKRGKLVFYPKGSKGPQGVPE